MTFYLFMLERERETPVLFITFRKHLGKKGRKGCVCPQAWVWSVIKGSLHLMGTQGTLLSRFLLWVGFFIRFLAHVCEAAAGFSCLRWGF